MLPIVLAAVSALVWGTADYSGGKATQRGNALAVTVVSQIVGLPLLALGLVIVPGEPRLEDLLWGAAAGGAGLGGIVFLYRALAGGAMTIVAPVTAVTAALVPMAVGLLTSRPPSAVALAGAVCAVVAIALVSVAPGGGRAPVTGRLIGLALVAGTLFGLFFALVGQASEASGLWPLAGVRFASVGSGLAIAAATRLSLRMPGRALRPAAIAGILDVTANALYLAAAYRGHLAIVAPVASLYPASTVVLALAVDRERLRVVQLAGLGLAAIALVLSSS